MGRAEHVLVLLNQKLLKVENCFPFTHLSYYVDSLAVRVVWLSISVQLTAL